ncbi:hypothetical protein FWK45_08830 [Histophilus somni]|uniref:Uncharacterized protein n=1 Tax=Histophilus somni TaxID=731 RepID=A0A9Q6YZF3_HISSO|nr:hypothetical protein [Histophilus somni]ARU65476.1 hypothetical protein BTV18_08190 [Histophilus somni]ARU67343.1 hypothetical protein BTV19_08620 [Histophilus somni]ARU69223.1 hypothetical protein BTV16_08635 [Histophilus somni]ARU71100.1 hypothetical protein BTV20_08640 [Histophilus somni]ARU72971.1 hypothetical protein BTV17_08615 [Histophilus somni]
MAIQIDGMMIFNLLVGVAVFFIGLWFKRLDKDFGELQQEIKDIKQDYQSKEMAQQINRSVETQLDRILSKLNQIEQKLDNKVDK